MASMMGGMGDAMKEQDRAVDTKKLCNADSRHVLHAGQEED